MQVWKYDVFEYNRHLCSIDGGGVDGADGSAVGGDGGAAGAGEGADASLGGSNEEASGFVDQGTWDVSSDPAAVNTSSMTFGGATTLGAAALGAAGAVAAAANHAANGNTGLAAGIATAAVSALAMDFANNGPVSSAVGALAHDIANNADLANAGSFNGMTTAAESIGADANGDGNGGGAMAA
jgi:hypothetical protein